VRPYGPDSPRDFDPAITYLTHGTYGACPRPVIEFQRALRGELESNPIRFLTRELEGRLDAARREVAAFLNADPEGLVVVPNATTGVATVLESLRLRPGDELLTNDHEYNATVNALETVAARLNPADVILVEGYKAAAIPKIEVRRAAVASEKLLAASDPLVLAIAADYEVDAHGRPVFNLDDIAGIASMIEETCGPFTRLRQRA